MHTKVHVPELSHLLVQWSCMEVTSMMHHLHDSRFEYEFVYHITPLDHIDDKITS